MKSGLQSHRASPPPEACLLFASWPWDVAGHDSTRSRRLWQSWALKPRRARPRLRRHDKQSSPAPGTTVGGDIFGHGLVVNIGHVNGNRYLDKGRSQIALSGFALQFGYNLRDRWRTWRARAKGTKVGDQRIHFIGRGVNRGHAASFHAGTGVMPECGEPIGRKLMGNPDQAGG